MTPLVKITIKLEPDGTWSCTRERKDSGESAGGLKDLEDVFDYIRAHGQEWEEKETFQGRIPGHGSGWRFENIIHTSSGRAILTFEKPTPGAKQSNDE